MSFELIGLGHMVHGGSFFGGGNFSLLGVIIHHYTLEVKIIVIANAVTAQRPVKEAISE
jgi:hypothetical protein